MAATSIDGNATAPPSPLAGVLGFDPLPAPFFLAVLAMIVIYLVVVEFAKQWFFAQVAQQPTVSPRPRGDGHHVSRRAARFSAAQAVRSPGQPSATPAGRSTVHSS